MNEIYKKKQEWIEAVMASEALTPAEKVFAFSIYKRAFGDKVTSFPSERVLMEDTGLSRSKFSTYRANLRDAGFITTEKRVMRGGGRPSYEYTLCLEGTSNVPTGDIAMYPEGTSNVPRGCGNTTRNTSIEDYKEENNTAAVADAPAAIEKDVEAREEETNTSLPQDETSSPLPTILSSPACERSEEAKEGPNVPRRDIAKKHVFKAEFPEDFTRDMKQAAFDARNKKRIGKWEDCLAYARENHAGIDGW